MTLFVDPGVPAPLPRQSISGGDVVPGAVMHFSVAQLHSSIPNTSGRACFSVDFRTVDLSGLFGDSVIRLFGVPPNGIDVGVRAACKGLTPRRTGTA